MRAVVQRVARAEVRVEGRRVGGIERGLLVLVAFAEADAPETLSWMAGKLWELRIFPDAAGRMNRSTREVEGSLLVVSQFTLYGDVSRGRRPSFVGAARPEVARARYDEFVRECRAAGGPVETGVFGAMMEVELINDGPVTLVVER
ncbi:MAG: D-aminoacyl-tRNA deacylase [Gemmatimonadota bacterium]